jgi:thymidylate synthase
MISQALQDLQGYWSHLDYCLQRGTQAESRVGGVRELFDIQMKVDPFRLPRRVKMRRELGYMEFLQFLCGVYAPDLIKRVAPKVDMSLFGDSAIYGPRVWNGNDEGEMDQLFYVIQELSTYPSSRRAILTISDPWDELCNQPCISSFQFQLRRNTLYTTVNIRSWDLWFGAPHDLIVLSGIAQVIAACLRVSDIGPLTINAGNAHIYEKSLEKINGDPLHWGFRIPLCPPELVGVDGLWGYRAWAREEMEKTSWLSGPPLGVEERDWVSLNSSPQQ